MNISKYLLGLSLALFLMVSARAQESSPPPAPLKYQMELVYIFEDRTPQFIFVIGQTGFKSIASLKKFLSTLPPGSILEWAPGCRRTGSEPILSSEQEMKDFKAFLAERKITFILVPSG